MRIIAFITDYAVVDRIINHIADIRGGETSPASRRLAAILLGLRGSSRSFFMIFLLAKRRGPLDFQHFPDVSAACEPFSPAGCEFRWPFPSFLSGFILLSDGRMEK